MPEPTPNPVVAAIPGGGWRIEYKDDDGTPLISPVLAWAIHADGTCKPIDVDPSGWCDDPLTAANFIRVYHPDEEEQQLRAADATAALARVQALADRHPAGIDTAHLHAAIANTPSLDDEPDLPPFVNRDFVSHRTQQPTSPAS